MFVGMKAELRSSSPRAVLQLSRLEAALVATLLLLLFTLSLPAIILNSSAARHTADIALSGLSATAVRSLYRRYGEELSFAVPSGQTLSVASALQLFTALDLAAVLATLLLYALLTLLVRQARKRWEAATPCIARYSVYIPHVPASATHASLMSWSQEVIRWAEQHQEATSSYGQALEEGHVDGPAAHMKVVEACVIDNYSDMFRFGDERESLFARLHLTEQRLQASQARQLSLLDEILGCFDGRALATERQSILDGIQDVEDRLLAMQAALRPGPSSTSRTGQAACAFISFNRVPHRDKFLRLTAERQTGVVGCRKAHLPVPLFDGEVPVVLPADHPTCLDWGNLAQPPARRWTKKRFSDLCALSLLAVAFVPTFFASWKAAEYSRAHSPDRCLDRSPLSFLARWTTFHTQAEADGWRSSTVGGDDTRLFCLCELQSWSSVTTVPALLSHPWSSACPVQTCTRLLALDPLAAGSLSSCSALLDRRSSALMYVTGASVIIVVVNYLILSLLPRLSQQEGHISLNTRALSVAWRLPFLLSLNTLLLPVLVNVAWPGMSYSGTRFSIGQHTDMVPAWYDVVCTQVLIALLLHAAVSMVKVALAWAVRAVCRRLGRAARPTPESDAGIAMPLATCHGELCFLVLMASILSSGVPLLIPIGLGAMVLVWAGYRYRHEGTAHAKDTMQPFLGDLQLDLAWQSLSTLPFAMALHVAVGTRMVGSVQYLTTLQQKNSPQALLQQWAGASFTGSADTSTLLPGIPARVGLGGVLVDVPVASTVTGAVTPFRFFAQGLGGFNDTATLESFYADILPALPAAALSFRDAVLSPVGASYLAALLLLIIAGYGRWIASERCLRQCSQGRQRCFASLPAEHVPPLSELQHHPPISRGAKKAAVFDTGEDRDRARDGEVLTYTPQLQPSIQRKLCIEPSLVELCDSLPELVMTKDVLVQHA